MAARNYFPGVGEAVADRTINRPGEKWADVAHRVALGNNALTGAHDPLEAAIADGRILLSGRHLQHGDASQPNRPQEVFTNCSTASQRAFLFYLLLNGSGVGSSYDDDMQIVNWDLMPTVVPVISADHDDFDGLRLSRTVTVGGEFKTPTEAWELYPDAEVFHVPDSREGWAEAVQFVEDLTFEGRSADKVVVIDFSLVRPKGAPIAGMQSRPSSGPVPLMQALARMNEIKGQRMPPWRQAMEIDHLLAEIVLVGGARRAARIAVKWWEDTDILEFINVKQTGGLWTANNSVGVDARFWSLVKFVQKHGYCPTGAHKKARDVFDACIEAQYRHGTGEPAFLNLDLLSVGEQPPTPAQAMKMEGKMEISATALAHRALLTQMAGKKKYPVIVNPCGEIRLSVNGGYCVIGDIAVAHCYTQEQFDEAARLTARALVRTNTMTALYAGEVRRTNRIGVALTGIHEYAWNRFGLTFYDLVEEGEGTIVDANGVEMAAPAEKAMPFWNSLLRAALEVDEELATYCDELGVEFPLTRRTIKPAGTTSKLFGLTEGAHLPAMREYLRWVQFTATDPLVEEYRKKGYPTRTLNTYKNVIIVGFPTRLAITEAMGDKVVTATEATFEQQIRWIRLIETFWLLESGGNQVSYTLKYDPKVVSEDEYRQLVLDNVPLVRAVSVMPQIDSTAYEYQPETPISRDEYDRLMSVIEVAREEIDREHLDCSSGACPIDIKPRVAA